MQYYPKGAKPRVPGKGEFSRREDFRPGTLRGQSFEVVGTQIGYVKKMPGFQTQPAGGRPSEHLAYRFTTPKGGRKW